MAGRSSSAGFLFNASATTGRESIELPQTPTTVTFFIDITGSATLVIELRDSDKTDYLPIRTITSDAIVKVAIPASEIAINITANSGTVTVTYRLVSVDNQPDTGLEVFVNGALEPKALPTIQLAEPVTIDGTITTIVSGGSQLWKKLAQVEIASSPATVYTVPASTQTDILTIILASTSGSDQVVTLWHDGSSDVNLIFPPMTILAGGQAVFSGHILLETGDTLVADCDAATAVTMTVYGKEQGI